MFLRRLNGRKVQVCLWYFRTEESGFSHKDRVDLQKRLPIVNAVAFSVFYIFDTAIFFTEILLRNDKVNRFLFIRNMKKNSFNERLTVSYF